MANTNPTKGLAAKALTNETLKSLKAPTDRPYYDVRDLGCRGLIVRVHASGVKSFRWHFRVAGKTKVETFGRFGKANGHISLKQARDKLEKAKAKHQAGERVGHAEDDPRTVAELAEIFYRGRIVPHRRRPEVVRYILDHDILPAIGRYKLDTLTKAQAKKPTQAAVAREAPVHAGKVLSLTKQLFRFAEAQDFIERSPVYAFDPKDFGVVNNERDRYLEVDERKNEIRAFWQAVDQAPRMSERVRRALKILLLTAVRSGELLNARWEHVDFGKNLWRIPRENIKTGETSGAWEVPLVPAVEALFRELEEMAGDSPWVLPGEDPTKPLTDKVLARAMARLFELKRKDKTPLLDIPKATPHDLRRTFKSHADDLDIERFVAEACLNHSLKAVERTYTRNTLIKKRSEALKKWADFVDLVVTERDNVKALRRG